MEHTEGQYLPGQHVEELGKAYESSIKEAQTLRQQLEQAEQTCRDRIKADRLYNLKHGDEFARDMARRLEQAEARVAELEAAQGDGHWAIENPGLADQFRQESKAVRKELGFCPESEDVSPWDLVAAIRKIGCPKGFVPVSESVIRRLADAELVQSALGKISPSLAAELGCTDKEEKAVEALYHAFESAVDFGAQGDAEPVAWLVPDDKYWLEQGGIGSVVGYEIRGHIPLYAQPPAAELEAEQ